VIILERESVCDDLSCLRFQVLRDITRVVMPLCDCSNELEFTPRFSKKAKKSKSFTHRALSYIREADEAEMVVREKCGG
jgi:hypothetical protein